MSSSRIKLYRDLVSPFNQSKILLHNDKFNEINQNIIAVPVCCEIDLADGFCNNKCPHCFFGTNLSTEKILIEKEVIIKTIKELRSLGVKAIEFSGGGEPLTHPAAEEIMKYTIELGFDVGLVTNGLLLNKVYNIAKEFTFIRISLDSATEQTYYVTHGSKYFNRVIKNIEKICTITGGNNIGIGYLITGMNNSDIIEASVLAKRLGTRFIQYRPASLEKPLAKHLLQEAINLVEDAARISDDFFQVFGAGIKWKHVVGERAYNRCSTSSLVSVIKANGDIPYCVLKRNDTKTILGNIYDNSFKDIFFSEKHLGLIKNNNILFCRKPCKHDSYNIMHECYNLNLMHNNFI